MKTMIIIFFLIFTFYLIATPGSLSVKYANNISLASSNENMHQLILYHGNNVLNPTKIMFGNEDIGNAKIEVFDLLGKLIYKAELYLSENSCDYLINREKFFSLNNPGILLVKLTTKNNQYLKKFTILV